VAGTEDYYAQRAPEFEEIYSRPERQADLARLRDLVEEFARGKRVLEVACGTGYWTEVLVRSARFVLATDVGDVVLAHAGAKGLPPSRVTFRRADAFALNEVGGGHEGAFAGFWWSHVPRARLPSFLEGVRRCLAHGAPFLVVDNRYVEGNSTPASRTDTDGNSYQQRVLAGGQEFEVIKNFPSPAEVCAALAAAGMRDAHARELDYYWYAGATAP